MGIFSRRNKDDDYNAWFNKGNSLSQLERHEEAIGCYDKAIRIDPENYNAWYNKGNSLAELERHKEAIECYGACWFNDERCLLGTCAHECLQHWQPRQLVHV